jgi:vacuolar iron transporter family protein
MMEQEPAPDQVPRLRANWQDEIDSAALYRVMAEMERRPHLAEVYQRLAAAEETHAHFWVEQLRATGQAVPSARPSWRARVLVWLAHRFGPQFVLPVVVGQEQANSQRYAFQDGARPTALALEELIVDRYTELGSLV